jgi:hypothetical protein
MTIIRESAFEADATGRPRGRLLMPINVNVTHNPMNREANDARD